MGQPRTPNFYHIGWYPTTIHNQPTRSLSLVAQIKSHHPVSISLEKQLPKPLLIPGGRVTVRKKGNKDSKMSIDFPDMLLLHPENHGSMRMSTALWQHPDSMSSRISRFSWNNSQNRIKHFSSPFQCSFLNHFESKRVPKNYGGCLKLGYP